MKRLIMVAIISLIVLFSIGCYAEGIDSSLKPNKEEKTNIPFDPENNLTSRYARGKMLSGKTKKSKKKKNVIELSYQGNKEPFTSFSSFVLGGPSNVYSGFIETIYYRDGIKVKDIYYESDAVKTNEVGIFFTNLNFVSEDGGHYQYKHVPYMVLNDKPTLFFSNIVYNENEKIVTGSMNIPQKNKPYYIELFYTDNEEYHYQEVQVKNKGDFKFILNREESEENMYLRVSDGYGNYGDACTISQKESFKYENIETIDTSLDETKQLKNFISEKFLSLVGLFFVSGNICLAFLIKVIMNKSKN